MSGSLKALLVGGPMYDPYQQIPNYFRLYPRTSP
jgi:hypothetical protein